MTGKLHVYANPTYDVIGGEVRVGGPALYASLAGRILGFRVYVYGAVGSDGHRALRVYASRGVRFGLIRFDLDSKTTRFKIEYVDGERRMVVEEPGPLYTSELDVEPRVVAPVLREFPRSLLPRLARRAYLDVQGLVRVRERGPLRYERGACSGDWIHAPSAIHGDAAELSTCLGAGGDALVEKLLEVSRAGVEVLATMGYRGLLLFEDGRVYRVKAWGPRTDDPTGMGDVLLSSYAYARNLGYDALTAARIAVVVCGYHAMRSYEARGIEGVESEARRVEAIRVDEVEAARMLQGR